MSSAAPVTVLGGGPAGAMAALTLARGGRACALLERNPEATDKVCGEFLSPEAVARLDRLGFPWAEADAVAIRRLRLESRGRSVCASLPFEGRSVRRSLLDPWLLRQAEKAGARVELGVHVRHAARRGDGFELHAGQGAGEGKHPLGSRTTALLVLATGKHAAGALHPRRPAAGPRLLGWKMGFRFLGPTARRSLEDCLSLFFFAGGYGGIARTASDLATVSILLEPEVLQAHAGGPLALPRALAAEAPALAELLAESEPAWERPRTIANLPYGHCDAGAAPGLFAVGDQFAVLPSFTGTGISFALASGALAAQTLLAAGPGAASFHYATRARALARIVLRRAMPLHRLLQRPAFARAAVTVVGWLPGVAGRVARRTRVPTPGEVAVPA